MDEDIQPMPQPTDEFVKETDSKLPPLAHISTSELRTNHNVPIPREKLKYGDVSKKVPVRIDEKTVIMVDAEKAKTFNKEHWANTYYHRKETISNGRVVRTTDDEPRIKEEDTK
jgi:hypothetical protein